MQMQTYTAVVHQEDAWYVAECPEIGVVSQGRTIEEAVSNLKEASELYIDEFAYPSGNTHCLKGSLAAGSLEL
jgi:predicted RNase H-like HicB family nuclease